MADGTTKEERMKMKLLFYAVSALLIPVYLFLSVFFNLYQIVGENGIAIAGSMTAVVGLIGLALGVFFFSKKKRVRTAFLCAGAGLAYALVILAAIVVLDAAHSRAHSEQADARYRALYGENWDAPPAVKGLPEHYETILNQYYAVVSQSFSLERIKETDLYAYTLPSHYGDCPEEEIGYALMDLDNDGAEELLIGKTLGDDGATVIFTAYTDASNPYPVLTGAEGELYYLHPGSGGVYTVEIAGTSEDGTPITGAWILSQGTQEGGFDFAYSDVRLDADARMTLELTPFSQYK